MADRPELTKRQKDVLEFIRDRIEQWGYPPTIREIGEQFGIRSTNGVADHLKALKRKGYLTQQDMKSRTLTPIRTRGRRPSRRRKGAGAIPVLVPKESTATAIPILGRVAAGEPILAEEKAEGTVVVDAFLVGSGKKLFALKVVGDSMIEDGIYDGDYIFVQKRAQADAGDIVVVIIEDEATVKRYYPGRDRIRLQPANSSMDPIIVRKSDFRDIQIIGVVVGVYRRL